MKAPKEILNIATQISGDDNTCGAWKAITLKAIKLAQIEAWDEAWDEAIELVAKKAKTKNTQVIVDETSTNSYIIGGIEVDKESILKLKKKYNETRY